MSKNTSILLGDRYEKFISAQITKGKYSSASEVIRTALRLLEDEELIKSELKKALVVGERSGFISDFNPKEHLKELHKRKSRTA